MKVIKALYDENTSFILNILEKFESQVIIETYDTKNYKNFKKGCAIHVNFVNIVFLI